VLWGVSGKRPVVVLALIATTLLLAVTAGSARAASVATESSTFQVDPAHDGYVYGAGAMPPLTKAWSLDLGWGDDYVAIDDGHVFAFSNTPAGHPEINAIDLATGQTTWSASVDDTQPSDLEVTVDGGRVFTAAPYVNSQSEAEILLSAFNETTGALLWKDIISSQPDPTPLIAHDGTLYFTGDGFGADVYAIDEADGKPVWTNGDLDVGNPVTLARNVLVIPTACGLTYALSTTNGDSDWTDDNDCDGGGTFMSSFNDVSQVWADSVGDVYNFATGHVIKHFSGYAPAFGYGEAVQAFQTSSSALGIRALDPSTGATSWTFDEPGGTSDPLGSQPLLADGYAFAEGSKGTVWALNPCTGAVVWQGATGTPSQYFGYDPLPSLAAGDGYLVAITDDGIVAFKGSGTPTRKAPVCSSSG
jgi:hypothetical protein